MPLDPKPSSLAVTVTFYPSGNPNTIYNVLARKLGRVPTNAELTAEVKRILSESIKP